MLWFLEGDLSIGPPGRMVDARLPHANENAEILGSPLPSLCPTSPSPPLLYPPLSHPPALSPLVAPPSCRATHSRTALYYIGRVLPTFVLALPPAKSHVQRLFASTRSPVFMSKCPDEWNANYPPRARGFYSLCAPAVDYAAAAVEPWSRSRMGFYDLTRARAHGGGAPKLIQG